MISSAGWMRSGNLNSEGPPYPPRLRDLPPPSWARARHPQRPPKKSATGSDQKAPEIFESSDVVQLAHRERDDEYCEVIVQLAPRWRVIVCKDYLQWIIQKRTAEPLHRGEWRGQSYVTSRNSLIRLCASLGLLSGDNARATLDALPEQFRGLFKK